MQLQPSQYAALKAAIAADPTLNAYPNTQDGAFNMAAQKLNVAFAPAFQVYKDLSEANTIDLGNVISYVAYAAMTTANQQQWANFYALNPQHYDPSRADIQSFMANTWSGALGGDGAATRAALLAYGIRNAWYIEKIYATGTGTLVSPAKMVFIGAVNYLDVYAARNS